MADFLRGPFFRPLKLGRASCGEPALPLAHIAAVVSSAKLASLPECSLLLCSFCCLALCLFPFSSLTFLPHLPCGRVCYLRDLTHQNQERNAHVFAVLLVSLGNSCLSQHATKLKRWGNVAERRQGRRFVKGKQSLPPWSC